MSEVDAGSVALVVTSPPYWAIKDYGVPGQIGYGQGLHEYLRDLSSVWRECFRALRDGGRLCVNVGDQFARASLYGRYRIIPLHAEVICQCGEAGFDFLGSIIWRKKTTMNTTGGAVVMGSYPYPPNGIVEIDYEHILLFRKPGRSPKAPSQVKRESALSREEWKRYFSGHWDVGGARKKGHEAPFPEEIPFRLIRMFSFAGDTVLDPFLGTGTTAKVALDLGRNAIGYDISAEYVEISRKRLLASAGMPGSAPSPAVVVRIARGAGGGPGRSAYVPRIADVARTGHAAVLRRTGELRTVTAVGPGASIQLDTGLRVRFAGVEPADPAAALEYLERRILGRKVYVKEPVPGPEGAVTARVSLKNGINVNAQLGKLPRRR